MEQSSNNRVNTGGSALVGDDSSQTFSKGSNTANSHNKRKGHQFEVARYQFSSPVTSDSGGDA